MDLHGTPDRKPMAVPSTAVDPEAVAVPGSLFERQGVLLRAIRQQARTRAMPAPTGPVMHLVNPRPESAIVADDRHPGEVKIATVTQIGPRTRRPHRALRPPATGERDDRVD